MLFCSKLPGLLYKPCLEPIYSSLQQLLLQCFGRYSLKELQSCLPSSAAVLALSTSYSLLVDSYSLFCTKYMKQDRTLYGAGRMYIHLAVSNIIIGKHLCGVGRLLSFKACSVTYVFSASADPSTSGFYEYKNFSTSIHSTWLFGQSDKKFNAFEKNLNCLWTHEPFMYC